MTVPKPPTGTTQSVSQATVDIGRVFVEGGFLGLVIYACLLIFFLLLVRDFLKDWLIRSVSKEQTAANKEVAESLALVASELAANNVTLSQMQSVIGWNEWQRARDRGELPRILDK